MLAILWDGTKKDFDTLTEANQWINQELNGWMEKGDRIHCSKRWCRTYYRVTTEHDEPTDAFAVLDDDPEQENYHYEGSTIAISRASAGFTAEVNGVPTGDTYPTHEAAIDGAEGYAQSLQ